MHVSHAMDEQLGLLHQRPPDPRMRVTRERDPERSREIEVHVSVDITHVGSPGLVPKDGKVLGQVGDVTGLD